MEKDEKNTQVFACKGMECKEMLEKLSEYIDGDLDPKLCEDLEKHMTDCNPCLIFVNTLKKTISLFKYASS